MGHDYFVVYIQPVSKDILVWKIKTPIDATYGEVTETRRYTNGILETEQCTKCYAKRVLQYPPGMIVESEPKPVPKFCVGKS